MNKMFSILTLCTNIIIALSLSRISMKVVRLKIHFWNDFFSEESLNGRLSLNSWPIQGKNSSSDSRKFQNSRMQNLNTNIFSFLKK